MNKRFFSTPLDLSGLREVSDPELPCPIPGCSLYLYHNSPCIPHNHQPETPEIFASNLLYLAQQDPEGFKIRIREMLRKGAIQS